MIKYFIPALLFFVSCISKNRDSMDFVDKQFQCYLSRDLHARIVAMGGINYGKGLKYMIQVDKALTLAEARIYALNCLEHFYEILLMSPDKTLQKQPKSELISITFSFIRSKYERQRPPNIAVVFFVDNKLYYEIYPEGLDKLVTVYEETFDQAKAKIKNS